MAKIDLNMADFTDESSPYFDNFKNVYLRTEKDSEGKLVVRFIRKIDDSEEEVEFIGYFEHGDHKVESNDFLHVADFLSSKIQFDEICRRAEAHNKTILNYAGKDLNGDKLWHVLCNLCNSDYNQRSRYFYKCKLCYNIRKTKSFEEFELKAIEFHGDRYLYNPDDYVNATTKTKIFCNTCKKHFLQQPSDHISGTGCPYCRESKGEKAIAKILDELSISYETQMTFDGLFYKGPLKFDFYLTEINVLMEFDGEHHFGPINYNNNLEKALENFESTKLRDKFKNDWALEKNIPLLRIPYWEIKNLREIIESFISFNMKKEEKQLLLEI